MSNLVAEFLTAARHLCNTSPPTVEHLQALAGLQKAADAIPASFERLRDQKAAVKIRGSILGLIDGAVRAAATLAGPDGSGLAADLSVAKHALVVAEYAKALAEIFAIMADRTGMCKAERIELVILPSASALEDIAARNPTLFAVVAAKLAAAERADHMIPEGLNPANPDPTPASVDTSAGSP